MAAVQLVDVEFKRDSLTGSSWPSWPMKYLCSRNQSPKSLKIKTLYFFFFDCFSSLHKPFERPNQIQPLIAPNFRTFPESLHTVILRFNPILRKLIWTFLHYTALQTMVPFSKADFVLEGHGFFKCAWQYYHTMCSATASVSYPAFIEEPPQ